MTIITKIEMGRVLTPAEAGAKDLYIQEQVANQLTNGANTGLMGNKFGGIRVWSTIEAANAYVAWANANYNPPPESAVVLTI